MFKSLLSVLVGALTLSTSLWGATLPSVLKANNDLAVKMFKEAVGKSPSQNVAVSPVPVTELVLALASSTKKVFNPPNETRNELLSLLSCFSSVQTDTDIDEAKEFLRLLGEYKQGLLKTNKDCLDAHQLFFAKETPLNFEFVEMMEKSAKITTLAADFTKPQSAVDTINNWAKVDGKNRFGQVVSPAQIKAGTQLADVSLSLTMGAWARPLEKPTPAKFAVKGGAPVEGNFISEIGLPDYVRTDSYQLAWKRYKDSDLCVGFVLPNPGMPVEEFISSTNFNAWKETLDNRILDLEDAGGKADPETCVNLRIPRAALTTPTLDLKDTLATLGIKLAFESKEANLPGLCKTPMALGPVLQKNILVLNESGTLAKAEVEAPAPRPAGKDNMVLNRPFIVFVMDDKTGTLLYLGLINSPFPKAKAE